jgi:hypothetical protein
VIARIWYGWEEGANADAYEPLVGEKVLPVIRRIDGFVGYELLRTALSDMTPSSPR